LRRGLSFPPLFNPKRSCSIQRGVPSPRPSITAESWDAKLGTRCPLPFLTQFQFAGTLMWTAEIRLASRLGWSAFQRCRAAATSGRSCSAACRVSFLKLIPCRLKNRSSELSEVCPLDPATAVERPPPRSGQVRRQPAPATTRHAAPAASGSSAPRSRADAPRLLMQVNPPDRERRAHRKTLTRRTPRASLGHRRDHPCAKIIRIGASSHGFLRIEAPWTHNRNQPRIPSSITIDSSQPGNALRPVGIHREFITAAARWIMEAKL
jgi:hypothetical protein